MATQETQQLDAIIDNSRRKMLTLGGTALAGLALASIATKAEAAVTDTDILNFALNLEYLEANFYNLAVYGVTIDQLTSAQGGPISIAGGGGTPGAVTTKPNFAKVDFSAQPLIGSYAAETALEEAKHVAFLSGALGSAAVCQPALDLYNSFNTLASSTTPPIGASFDPFDNPVDFILAAYIFEDVGVSAYHGAAPYISDKVNILPAAVGIHAVEAYHSGLIRTAIAGLDYQNGNTTYSDLSQRISALRTTLTNTQPNAPSPYLPPFDVGVSSVSVALNGGSNQYSATTISDADLSTGAAGGRTTAQVLAIVTAGNSGGASGYNSGLFFPAGLNGNIR